MTSRRVHQHLLERSRGRFDKIHLLIEKNGPLSLEAHGTDLFEYMAKTVAGQQLSAAAARTIWSRVKAIASESGKPLSESCCESGVAALRSCGLSRNKVKALMHLRRAFADGSISEAQIRASDYANVSEMVSRIWGFGSWSADMIAIFYCGLPDVWSEGDSSLQKGLGILTNDSAADTSEIAPVFSPYRSYLALHVWKGIDDRFLTRSPK